MVTVKRLTGGVLEVNFKERTSCMPLPSLYKDAQFDFEEVKCVTGLQNKKKSNKRIWCFFSYKIYRHYVGS